MADDIIRIELKNELDLHAFQPEDVIDVLREFIDHAREKRIRNIRIVHGKGKSVFKGMVLKELGRNGSITGFRDEPGNWGATLATVRFGDE